MGKGNIFMGTASGKIGDVVLMRRNGQQVQRMYIQQVKNPNTVRQASQRTLISNVVSFYRSARTLLNHSMTGRKASRSSYNEFVAANLGRIKVYIPKGVADKQGCVVAPYQISRGVLPAIEITGSGDDAVTNIALGTLTPSATTTIGEFAEAILANNASFSAGDQLSYVSFIQGQNVELGIPTMTCGYYEVTLDVNSQELLSAYWPEQAYNAAAGFLAHGEHVANGGFVWIRSRKNADGTLEVSPQYVIMNDTTMLSAYMGENARLTAIASYGASDDPFLVPGSNSSAGTSSAVNVSSVSIGGKTLTPGSESQFSMAAQELQVVVTGTNLDAVEAASIKADSTTIAGTSVVATPSKVTFNITPSSAINANSVTLLLDGKTVYKWDKEDGGHELG